MQNPNSMVVTIYKAKYFLNLSILEAPLGRCPSFVWRSMLKTRNVVEFGMVWGVGDGKNINIWGDQGCLLLPYMQSNLHDP